MDGENSSWTASALVEKESEGVLEVVDEENSSWTASARVENEKEGALKVHEENGSSTASARVENEKGSDEKQRLIQHFQMM